LSFNVEAFRKAPSITVDQVRERVRELNTLKETNLDSARKNLVEKSIFINLVLLEILEGKKKRYH
jgi:hypothetical protein